MRRTSVGTDVIMHLKADTDEEKYSEYLRRTTGSAQLVKKYSDYIRYPIRMRRSTQHGSRRAATPRKPEYEYVDEMDDGQHHGAALAASARAR